MKYSFSTKIQLEIRHIRSPKHNHSHQDILLQSLLQPKVPSLTYKRSASKSSPEDPATPTTKKLSTEKASCEVKLPKKSMTKLKRNLPVS